MSLYWPDQVGSQLLFVPFSQNFCIDVLRLDNVLGIFAIARRISAQF